MRITSCTLLPLDRDCHVFPVPLSTLTSLPLSSTLLSSIRRTHRRLCLAQVRGIEREASADWFTGAATTISSSASQHLCVISIATSASTSFRTPATSTAVPSLFAAYTALHIWSNGSGIYGKRIAGRNATSLKRPGQSCRRLHHHSLRSLTLPSLCERRVWMLDVGSLRMQQEER